MNVKCVLLKSIFFLVFCEWTVYFQILIVHVNSHGKLGVLFGYCPRPLDLEQFKMLFSIV